MESRVCALYSFDDQGMLALERTYYDKAKILEQLPDEAARTDVQLGLEELAARVCTRPWKIQRCPESGSEMSRGGSGRAGTAPSGGRVRS